MQYLF